MTPSEVRMFTEIVSAAVSEFAAATAAIKPEVLSKGIRIRLAAGPAGAVASCAGLPGAALVKMA
jgi:hypothetical protein